MGTLTITPNTLSDWNANPDRAAYDAVLTRVLSDLHDAFVTPTNLAFTFIFQWNATAGNGASSTWPIENSFTYSQIKTAYQALSPKSSIQTNISNNFPSSTIFGSNGIWIHSSLAALLGLTTFNGNSTNVTIGSSGTRDTTVDGSTCAGGQASLYGTLMHEITECLGRAMSLNSFFGANTNVMMGDMLQWSAPGTRQHSSRSGRYVSDDGTLNYGNLDPGGGDVADTVDTDAFDTSVGDVFGVAPSRSSSLPLIANNWKYMNALGWPLSATGLTWAGLSNPPTCSVNPVASGTPTAGQTLSTTDGTWANSPTFTYQWQNNGSNIGGQTSNSTTVLNSQRDGSLRCVVTGTNGAGNASANSNSLGPVITTTKASPFLR